MRVTCVYPHVVLVVGSAGERSPAGRLRTQVRPLARVRARVNLADVGRGEGTPAALERTFKRLLT